MAFRDRLLPRVDRIRAIPGRLGLHRFRVYVRVITYASSVENRVGTSAVATTVETELLVNGRPPHVRAVTSKDLVAGSDEFGSSQTFEIGPVTPEFAGGGVLTDTITPLRGATPSTLQYRLTGPGLPSTGLLCKKTDAKTDRPFRYMITVQSIGRPKR